MHVIGKGFLIFGRFTANPPCAFPTIWFAAFFPTGLQCQLGT